MQAKIAPLTPDAHRNPRDGENARTRMCSGEEGVSTQERSRRLRPAAGAQKELPQIRSETLCWNPVKDVPHTHLILSSPLLILAF